MGADRDFTIPQDHDALGVQEDRHSAWCVSSPCPKSVGQHLLCVGPHLESKLLVLHPLRRLRWRAEAHSNDLHAKLRESVLEVAEPATLARSARGPGRRKEPDQRGMAQQVFP